MDIDHCYNFSDEVFLTVNSPRVGLSILSVLISIPVLVLRVLQCYKRSDLIKHTDRLMVYACITTTLYALVESTQTVRIYNLERICTVIGVFVQYFSLSILIITTCIGCHLIILICHTSCLKHPPRNTDMFKKHEVVYLFLTVLLPLLFIPWPFMYNSYGHSGAFCWIEITDEDCKPVRHSVVLVAMLYYVWVALVLPFTLGVVVAVVVTLCLRRAQKVRFSTYVVLFYMVVFFVTFAVNMIAGILVWSDPSAVWYVMIQSVAEPFFTIFTTATLLVQLCWSKCHVSSHKKFAFDDTNNGLEDSYLIPSMLKYK